MYSSPGRSSIRCSSSHCYDSDSEEAELHIGTFWSKLLSLSESLQAPQEHISNRDEKKSFNLMQHATHSSPSNASQATLTLSKSEGSLYVPRYAPVHNHATIRMFTRLAKIASQQSKLSIYPESSTHSSYSSHMSISSLPELNRIRSADAELLLPDTEESLSSTHIQTVLFLFITASPSPAHNSKTNQSPL